MTEQPIDDAWDESDAAPAVERPESTGLPRVDAVVDAVADLADRPLDEQVAAFEAAHAELRGTLDHPDVPGRA